jgi:flagellar basal-body rod modification protein FlgD
MGITGEEVRSMEVPGVGGLEGGTVENLFGSPRVLGKDDFLRLLTVQLQHQDPLEPQQNTEMVAQLAQFSSLEQLENMNRNLASSLDLDLILTQVLNNTAAAGLIGKSVLAGGRSVVLDASGDAVPINFDLAANANSLTVAIYDESGTLVRKIEESGIEAGRRSIEWDGKDSSGNSLSGGTYTFQVTATDGEGNSIDVSPLVMGSVDVVKFVNGEAVLVIGGVEVAISQIIEIYKEEA